MYKYIPAILCLFIFGCNTKLELPEPPPYSIAPKTITFSDEQQVLLRLLGNNKQLETIAFSYNNVEKAYKKVEYGISVYKKGKLIGDGGKVTISKTCGSNCIDTNRLNSDIWAWSMENRDDKWFYNFASTSQYAATFVPAEDYPSIRVTSMLDRPVPIEDSKEIVLYAASFSNLEALSVNFDLQAYANPENFKNDEYTHVITCKFSN